MKTSPISTQERIVTIDIIRGFALFGIFLVNMPAFHTPDFMKSMYGMIREHTGLDFWVDLFFQCFVQMKFFTIFSFLFGLGFYIFMSRAEAKGLNVNRLFTRRIIALFMFGAIHIVFLWFGDILHLYAITGILLLLFYKRKNKTLIIWAFSVLLLINLLMSMQLFIPTSVIEDMQSLNDTSASEKKMEEYVDVYENANYFDWVSYRLGIEIPPIASNIPYTMMPVLAMFLLGLYAGRKGFFKPDTKDIPFIKKTQIITFIISIPLVAVLALIMLDVIDLGIKNRAAAQLFTSLSGVSLSLFYISTLTLLLRKKTWQKALRPLGYVGQMALTNYLSQTVICLIIFLGFGLYGKISLATGTLIVIVVYFFQIIFSRIWLDKFKFGPMEWLWRSFTYGSFQSMKKGRSLDN